MKTIKRALHGFNVNRNTYFKHRNFEKIEPMSMQIVQPNSTRWNSNEKVMRILSMIEKHSDL